MTLSVYELAAAAGCQSDIDPTLIAAIGSMQTGKKNCTDSGHKCILTHIFTYNDHVSSPDNTSPDEEYKLFCLLLLYIAVSLPTLASDPNSLFSREHGGTLWCPAATNCVTLICPQAALC